MNVFEFHSRLMNAIDNIDAKCGADDCECETAQVIGALLHVIAVHRPVGWDRLIDGSGTKAADLDQHPECATCHGLAYPEPMVRQIAEEFGVSLNDEDVSG